MLQTVLIVDSRHIVPRSFEVEAGFASFHRFLQTTIPNYIAICDTHSWIRRPLGLVILNDSAEMPKIISGRFLEVKIASKALEPPAYRFAGAPAKLAGESWGQFLLVAVQKISEMLNGSLSINLQMTAESTGRIVIYSTDILLTGDDAGDTIISKQLEENVQVFCKSILQLQQKFQNVRIEIVCVTVNELPSLHSADSRNSRVIRSLQVILKKSLNSSVFFTVLRNSVMYFEEELRRLVAAHAPLVHTKLEFPPVNGDCLVSNYITCQFNVKLLVSTPHHSLSNYAYLILKV